MSVDETILLGWMADLAHVLPGQKPIEAFVHHNTLHPFEHLHFRDAVESVGEMLGAEPYVHEREYREAWKTGRILRVDLDDVLSREVEDEEVCIGGRSLNVREIVCDWMLALPEGDEGATLRWRLEETDELAQYPSNLPRAAFERLSSAGPAFKIQPALWRGVRHRFPPVPVESQPHRVRDVVLDVTGTDTDEMVNSTLIRWCSAYLDFGHSYWPMSDREKGFYTSMLMHMSRGGPTFRGWMRSLRGVSESLLTQQTSAARCILDTLERLGWPEEDFKDYLREALIAMPGWPGMFVQIAERPDLTPGPAPSTPLEDYLAIRLLLEEAAARSVTAHPKGVFERQIVKQPPREDHAWVLFNAVRLIGVLPEELNDEVIDEIDHLLVRFCDVRRRWYWQLAYERRYRVNVLDGVMNHWERVRDLPSPSPAVQVVTCIDDREESLRRYIEELRSDYQTFGGAAFFGVAAYVQRLNHPERRPLCPASIIPTHLVKEVLKVAEEGESLDHMLGRAHLQTWVGTKTLFRGMLLSLWGWAAIFPMAAELLSPGEFSKNLLPAKTIPTKLQLDFQGEVDALGKSVGFTVQEMADIVSGMLKAMGLTKDFAPLILILGHGSHSINNPHAAAYNCGACAGGRGDVNARAFAALANRPDVREILRGERILLTDAVWFVGGYHDTCNDEIAYYDTDLVPASHQEKLKEAREVLEIARRLDAQERTRRFMSAQLDLSPEDALQHVQIRSKDLSQPRPEYNHAGNALCLVGRRAWSRGLFLDRRAFVTSYDPGQDPEAALLEKLLLSVGPVGAGINLEYYFSYVDKLKYGSDNKLPHNIVSLIGVMDGHSSDLRTGLYWQMVEIHEPIRLLNVIEARPDVLEGILDRQPGLKQLIVNRWILVAAFDPETNEMWFLEEEGFVPHHRESKKLATAARSWDFYHGHREHLPLASIGIPNTPEVTA